MIRLSIPVTLILGLAVVSGHAAQDTRELSCVGKLIEPAGVSQTDKTIKMTLGASPKVTLDLGQGTDKPRVLSDNQIQLKFKTKDYVGEYFHYSGDLFLIYASGRLMRLTCK